MLAQLEEKCTLKYIQTFEDVIDKTRHVYYKSLIYMFKKQNICSIGKRARRNLRSCNGKAITFAELLDDEVLVQIEY